MQDDHTDNIKVGDLVLLKDEPTKDPAYVTMVTDTYCKIFYHDPGGRAKDRFWRKSTVKWRHDELILIKDDKIIKEYLPLFRFAIALYGANEH